MHRAVPCVAAYAALGLALGASGSATAGCELELELLAADLKGVKVTEAQAFQLAPHVEDALRYCRTGHEGLGLRSIEKARMVAGIPEPDPLDSPADRDAADEESAKD